MNTFQLTEDRIKQILPQNIREAECLSDDAKRVFAAILNGMFTQEIAKRAGFLAISNENLRANAGIGKEYFMAARQELLEVVPTILEVVPGRRRQKGKTSMATEYYPKWENLDKPIRKKTFIELMEMVNKTPETPISPANTNAKSDSESDTKSDSESNTYNINRTYGSLAPLEEGAAPKNIKENVKKTDEELNQEFIEHMNKINQILDDGLKGVPYSKISETANKLFSCYTNTMSIFDPNRDRLNKAFSRRVERIKTETLTSMLSN